MMKTANVGTGEEGRSTRSFSTRWLLPLLTALILWGVFFHGLPSRITQSIPFTAYHQGATETSRLVPGDHLQLLYHFWLTREKVTGRTPLLYNVYEFNTGYDRDRREVDPGYVPFSLVYAAVTEVGGSHALGWNLAQLAAVLTAFFFLYCLALRYVKSRWMALAGATLASCLPYQWMNLGGGSPTGFGMAFLPVVALGLDIAVREGRARGGLLAGIGLLFCYTSDLHCMAFACMLIPAWCIVAWFSREDGVLPNRRSARQCWRGLSPTVLAGIIVIGIAKMLTSFYAATDAAGGRTVQEVMRNSPSKRAMFGAVIKGIDSHFRVGFVILIFVVLTLALVTGCALRRRYRRENGDIPVPVCKTPRPFTVVLLMFSGVLLVLLLAMGFNAPLDGLPIRIVRAIAPPYKMIRQPIKVFCVLPTLLAPLFAIGFATIRPVVVGILRMEPKTKSIYCDLAKGLAGLLILAIVIGGVVETASALRLGLSKLPGKNDAYEAVVADAAVKGCLPLVLALPIWPGDSAWSSLYEYNAMLHGVRMVNGYAAVCTEGYLKNIYKAFESLTQGRLTDEQAGLFRWHGITAVVLYQNAFPEQVSPFPVDVTVRRLMENPNLDFLVMDDMIAFSVRNEKATVHHPGLEMPEPSVVSPARRWSSVDSTAAPILSDIAKAWLRSPVAGAKNLTWMIRVRGVGDLRLSRKTSVSAGETGGALLTLETNVNDWSLVGEGENVRWLAVPVGDLEANWAQAGVEVIALNGIEILDVLLVDGTLPLHSDEITIPATSLFHGGVIDVDGRVMMGVQFQVGHDAAEEILYGFNLPLDSGKWRVSVSGDFPATDVGVLRVLSDGVEVAKDVVGAGAKAIEFEAEDLAPIALRFRYSGVHDIRVEAITLSKVVD